jgi:methylmalonyl-CoA epimerase
VTLQALAAVLGGTQSLHTNGADEALGLPTADAARVALRTQQIIAYESGVTDVADPLGGSYYVEALTADLVARATATIAEIDRMGGAVAAVESGWMQEQIGESAYRAQQAIERGDAVIVGVNKFADPRAARSAMPIQRVGAAIEREQVERLRAFRAARDAAAVQTRLGDVRQRHAGARRRRRCRCDARRNLRRAAARLRHARRARAHRMIDAPIDHVAIVVEDLQATIDLYTGTLGFSEVYRETVADQGVEAVGLRSGEAIIELLRPLDPASPIAVFRGSARSKLHHTAYRVDDISAELTRLRAAGVRLIDEVPRRGAHGNTIAFLHPKSTGGVLIELCQRA